VSRLLAVVLALAALGGAPAVAAACPRAALPDVEDEVMCTICGTPLNISEAPSAADERAFIRERIAACDTKAQIKDKLVVQYGEEVLALPKDRGFNRAVYLVPIAALLAALAALAFAVPRWRRRRGGDGGDGVRADALAPADARRLDDDLARYDL
jgi:cytochrome c-type biogenesis protein CcmH/NrfF